MIGADLSLNFWPLVMVNARHFARWEMGLLHFDLLLNIYHMTLSITSCDKDVFGTTIESWHEHDCQETET
jgi:hypothetical protein